MLINSTVQTFNQRSEQSTSESTTHFTRLWSTSGNSGQRPVVVWLARPSQVQYRPGVESDSQTCTVVYSQVLGCYDNLRSHTYQAKVLISALIRNYYCTGSLVATTLAEYSYTVVSLTVGQDIVHFTCFPPCTYVLCKHHKCVHPSASTTLQPNEASVRALLTMVLQATNQNYALQNELQGVPFAQRFT